LNAKTLMNICYGLYIVSSRDDEHHNAACVVNTVMQVTETPPCVVVAINKKSDTHNTILRSGRFNVSILDQTTTFDIIAHFGFKSSRDTDKFSSSAPVTLEESGGVYRLASHSNGYLACKTAETKDLGTHTLFFGNVAEAELLSEAPTLSYSYYQSHIKPKPKQAAQAPKTKLWHCEVCGFEIEAESLPPDYICPVCKHGIEAFVEVKPKTEPSATPIWHCKVCGFEIEAKSLPPDYICPLCKHGIEAFVKIEPPAANVPPTPSTQAAKVWRCRVCGYETKAESLPPDFTCPLCGEGVEAFSCVS